jgi:succinoglycan biosynthesis transport protein ExoP
MSLERFTEILRARWRLAAFIWVLVVGAVALASFASAPRYTATVSVMVEPRVPDPILGMPSPNGMPNHMPTEIDVVQSERVIVGALRSLGMQEDPEWIARWNEATGGRGDMESWLATQVLRQLDVRPSRDSNVLMASYRAEDPDKAARGANAIMQSYIQNSSALRLEPAREYKTYFDQSAKRLRDSLEQAQAKLSAYQQQHRLVGTDERFDVETLKLTELNSRVVALEAGAAQAAERGRQAALNQDGMDEVQRNPAVFALTSELTRLEGRETELRSRMGDEHPSVLETRVALKDVRTRLGAAMHRASRGIAIDSRIAGNQLAQLQQALEQQRAKILAMKAERDGAQVLQREVDNAQRAYDAVLTRSSQTAVEAGASRPNVSILKEATRPPRPDWPRHRLNLAAAAVAGLLLAVLAALWREQRDRRLRSPEDVPDLLGHSLLIVLPNSSAKPNLPLLRAH